MSLLGSPVFFHGDNQAVGHREHNIGAAARLRKLLAELEYHPFLAAGYEMN